MIVGVIPLKRLDDAKGRLAPFLPPEERVKLVLALAERAVDAMQTSGVVDRIAIVSPEPHLAERWQVESLPDPGDLNGAIARGAAWARSQGARGMLVLPADLPEVQAADVLALVEGTEAVVVAPTHDGGTGALFLSPPDAIPPAFGPDSARRHLQSAGERGLRARELSRAGLAFDLDTREDLARMAVLESQGASSARSRE